MAEHKNDNGKTNNKINSKKNNNSRRKFLLTLAYGVAASGLIVKSELLDASVAKTDLASDLADATSTPDSLAKVETTTTTVKSTIASVEPVFSPPQLISYKRQSVGQLDIAINNGIVIDPETNFTTAGSVGVVGNKIVEISDVALEANQVIDAGGNVICPGFVDILSYEPNSFGVWLKIADGVTTNLAMHGVGNYAKAFFSQYEGKTPIHFGGAFNQHVMRSVHLKADTTTKLTPEEIATLARLSGQSVDNGLAGVSFSPEYSPGSTKDELTAVAQAGSDKNQVLFFHVRHSDSILPDTGLEAINEAIEIARAVGAPLHIEHITSTGGTHMMAQVIEAIDRKIADGQDITACLYPYNFWGTFLASQRFSEGWQKRYKIDYENLQIAGTSETLTESSFAEARSENKLVAALDSIPDGEIVSALGKPWVMVASDAITGRSLNNHPRGAGTFSRTLAKYVRQDKVLSLNDALAKMTILPAKRVEGMIPQMKSKGRMQLGADADICVFNPDLIEDKATIEEPGLPAVGVTNVLVDGNFVMRDGVIDKSAIFGKALRSA